MIRLNHPDKHATLSKDSPEFHQFVENTKRLNSIDYQSSTGSMNRPQEQAEEASARAEYSAAVSVPFTPPKTAAELLSKLNGTGPFYDASGKGSPYFQAVKEYIPNLLSWTQSGDIDQSQCGKESGWVISQISTKFYLKGYQGADILVSALVSRDQDRIKKAFDEMLTHIKNKNVFQRGLFWSTNSFLDDFINKFCRFKPISEMGGLIAGIDASTVIVLCQSLSLDLPYNIYSAPIESDHFFNFFSYRSCP